MVTKTKKNMILLIMSSLFFAGCFTINGSQSNKEMLLFENYTKANIKLQEHFLNENIYFKDSVFLSKELLLRTKQGSEIDGDPFDILCNIEIINQWKIYNHSDISPYSNDYKQFVEERKKELKLEYLGSLCLSQAFNSFLILVSDKERDDYNIIKKVFLINTVDNAIVSITRMCYFSCFDGECNYIFTKEIGKGVFLQKDIEDSSNVVLPEEIKTDNVETGIRFAYDKKGRLKLL